MRRTAGAEAESGGGPSDARLRIAGASGRIGDTLATAINGACPMLVGMGVATGSEGAQHCGPAARIAGSGVQQP